MLRCLAIAPLLFASALLADEDDALQQALARRIRQSERIVELTKKQAAEIRLPTALLDAEIELTEARLDAAGDRQDRMEQLKRVVDLCGQRMLLAQAALDAGKIDSNIAERGRLAWFQARLRRMRAASDESPEKHSEWQQIHLRRVAEQVLEAARLRDKWSALLWDVGVLGFESRVQAIEDLFRAETETAENDSESLMAYAKRSARLDELVQLERIKFDTSIGYPVDGYYVARDAALRARIALILQMRDPADNATWRELALYRTARLETLMRFLRVLKDETEHHQMSISYMDGLLTLSLDCPAELWTPAERRLVFTQAAWVLELIERSLPTPEQDENSDFRYRNLEFAWLERLRTKLEIWDLRRSAQEPPRPKVFPAE